MDFIKILIIVINFNIFMGVNMTFLFEDKFF